MSTNSSGKPHLRPLRGRIRPENIWKDVAAGVTLAALGIPEVMGYTRISLTPVVTGLYTMLVPVVVFALLGSSRHLVVAADSATAAILAGALVQYAAPYSQEYVGLTCLLALLCAAMLLLARVLRLGFLADFLSRSALIGFLSGVGFQVASGELGPLLGIHGSGHTTITKLWGTLTHLNSIQPWTAGVAGGVVLVIVLLARFAPRFPGALVAVVGATAASYFFNWQGYGVPNIGAIPGGLPHFNLLFAHWNLVPALLATAASCTIVIIAQSTATSRSYAFRFEDELNVNRDLVGLAGANFAASVSGTFVVNGSPTKTEMVDMAGGSSQLAQLSTAAIILLVLLFFTQPLSYMPAVVLSAVVFLIGVRLIDIGGFRELYKLRHNEFRIACATALTVAFIGVEQGILLAIAISVVDHLRRSYRPPTHLLTLAEDGETVEFPTSSKKMALPGLLIYSFEAPLYYANAGFFMSEVLQLVQGAEPAVRWFIVGFATIADVDYSASKMLLDLIQRLQKQNVSLVFSDVHGNIGPLLQRYGITAALGEDKLYPALTAAVTGYRNSVLSPPGTSA